MFLTIIFASQILKECCMPTEVKQYKKALVKNYDRKL